LSNAVERTISAALTLVILPFQVRILGIEAYGILGFVASLQVIFNILDLGLGPTVIREVAADGQRGARYAAVFHSLTTVYWAIAGAIGVLLAATAPWIAARWLHPEALPLPTVILAIRLIAFSILLRWPVALYAGAITGAQRLDLVNAVRIGVSVLKLGGGVAVLVYSRSLVAYLLWLVFAAFVEVVAYMFAAVRIVPGISLRPRFSMTSLKGIWRYSLHMNMLSILAVMIVQADRIVISRALPIAELGFYSVAYSTATVLSVVQSLVTAALFPAFVAQIGNGQWPAIRLRFRMAVELLLYLLSGCACVLIFYGRGLLTLWISSDAASRSAQPLSILSLGFLLGAAVSVPYTLAVAAGRTRVPLVINLAAAPVYIVTVTWAVQVFGIGGAAWAWVGLNAYYLAVLVPLATRSMPMEPLFGWLLARVLLFGGVAAVTIGGSALLASAFGGRLSQLVGIVIGVGGYGALVFFLLDDGLRSRLKSWRSLEAGLRVPAA
jgi:O-antigen/teichoic acid export membrane protein